MVTSQIPQTHVTTFAQVSKFRFGGPVQTSEGEMGTLGHVLVDPAAYTLSHIAVKLRYGPFAFGREFYVPFAQVGEATADLITLKINRETLESAKDVPSGVKLTSGVTVSGDGKRLGRLAQLTFETETRKLRHLIVDRGVTGEWVVPAQAVVSLDAKQITADLRSRGVSALAPYRPDEELIQDIRDAAYNYPRLRIDMNGLDVRVIDGVVWLRGHVSSDLNRRLVEDQVKNVHGIAELHNELIADNELAANIAWALNSDPRLHEERIGVYPALGLVHLRGAVHTEAEREAAIEVARKTPGVRGVVNELHVSADANVLPVMAGVTGDEDMVPGGR